jgi:hypothetical protein
MQDRRPKGGGLERIAPLRASTRDAALPAALPPGPRLLPALQRRLEAAIELDPQRRAMLASAVEDQPLGEAARAMARAAAAQLDRLLAPASPAMTTGRPPVSTTTTWVPRVWPGAGTRRIPGSSSSSPSTGGGASAVWRWGTTWRP